MARLREELASVALHVRRLLQQHTLHRNVSADQALVQLDGGAAKQATQRQTRWQTPRLKRAGCVRSGPPAARTSMKRSISHRSSGCERRYFASSILTATRPSFVVGSSIPAPCAGRPYPTAVAPSLTGWVTAALMPLGPDARFTSTRTMRGFQQ